MSPRRMIWFNQNAPQNKMDLWLSYNKHYEDQGEDEAYGSNGSNEVTDNPSQRSCDLILKAWDCGKWVPIVGFNTTSAHKIDCVGNENKTVHHPALYTETSPAELQDEGSLGEVMLKYITQEEWGDIFNSQNFYNAWNGNNTHVDVPRAQSNKLGGIWASTFASGTTGFAQCKFKANNDSNVYVSGADIISAINTYIASGGTGHVNVQLANLSEIGGIKADVWGSDTTYSKLVEAKLYPTINPKFERLSINVDDVTANIAASLSDEQNRLFIGGNGIIIGQTLDGTRVEWALAGLKTAEAGKYPRSKVVHDAQTGVDNHTIEWVDLPCGGNYQVLASGSSEQYHYVVKGGSDNKHFLNGDGEWAVPEASGTTYTAGVGLYLVSNEFCIDARGVASGYVLGANGLNGVEWVPMASGSTIDIVMNNVNASGEDLWIVSDEIINNDGLLDKTEEWNAYNITNFKSFNGFGTLGDHNNPIYIKMDVASGMPVVASGTTLNVIDSNNCISGNAFSSAGTHLFTIQFGTLKVEKVTSIQGYSPNAENN